MSSRVVAVFAIEPRALLTAVLLLVLGMLKRLSGALFELAVL